MTMRTLPARLWVSDADGGIWLVMHLQESPFRSGQALPQQQCTTDL